MDHEPVGIPKSSVIALMTVEHVHGYRPTRYIGLISALGSTVLEAEQGLERRALHVAREAQAGRPPAASGHLFAVLGVRITAAITASGQPEWLAYGTLVSGHREADQGH